MSPLRLAVLTVILFLIASPAAAQVAGRWIVWIDNGAPATLRGELRLTQEGERVGGAILLESRDATPIPLAGGRFSASQIEFAADLGATTRFIARLTGDRLSGSVEVDGAPAGRWGAERLQPGIEHYPALPRFVVRQLQTERAAAVVIPGPWAAAAAALPARDFVGEYRDVAERAGVLPLVGDELQQVAPARLLGLVRRAELREPMVRVLSEIRTALRSDTARARFDLLFRPRGGWVLDLHDAALTAARIRARNLSWSAAAPALAAAGWLDDDSAASGGGVPNALYQLLLLRDADSLRFVEARDRIRGADRRSGAAVDLLLDGYDQAVQWHRQALALLLREPWIVTGDGTRARSIAELVTAEWAGRVDSVVLPPIQARLFAAPQAVPRYGVPQPLFDRIVLPQNLAATEWLARHGPGELLRTLRKLPADTVPLLLQADAEPVRVISVAALARASLNGFLEPRDEIAIDPAYPPLLALGTVVHEWEHLLLERARLTRLAERTDAGEDRPVVLPAVDPYLAEGFAEWTTERVLAPLARRWAIVLLGEWEKRARLAAAHPDGVHLTGYALVRALAGAVGEPGQVTELLARHGHSPAAVAADTLVRRAWPSETASTPARTLRGAGNRALIPQITFTIEDRVPDLVSTLITFPYSPSSSLQTTEEPHP